MPSRFLNCTRPRGDLGIGYHEIDLSIRYTSYIISLHYSPSETDEHNLKV